MSQRHSLNGISGRFYRNTYRNWHFMLAERMTNEHALQDLLRITDCVHSLCDQFTPSTLPLSALPSHSVLGYFVVHERHELASNQHLFEQDIENVV